MYPRNITAVIRNHWTHFQLYNFGYLLTFNLTTALRPLRPRNICTAYDARLARSHPLPTKRWGGIQALTRGTGAANTKVERTIKTTCTTSVWLQGEKGNHWTVLTNSFRNEVSNPYNYMLQITCAVMKILGWPHRLAVPWKSTTSERAWCTCKAGCMHDRAIKCYYWKSAEVPCLVLMTNF